ncbi:peroxisomal membrane protein 11A isoform X2 [Centroberyx affinis]|uniref:peroxisomal membrane protein 11A isoform X2 n=1 Tax=Centroberyx affinis TaxID=166261 RepID=UPI003A5C2DF5
MDTFIKFTNQSQGRDRIFRATQYACALSKYLLRNSSGRKELVAKLKSLESNMSAGRKSNINRALYFICDNVLWARSVGLINDINKDRWSLNASRYYLLSLVMGLTRDVYVISQLVVQRTRDKHFQQRLNRHLSDSPEVAEVVIPQLDAFLFLVFESLKTHPAVALDMLKNICDLFIPLDRLGIYQSNAGVVGFCGLISSLLGIVTLIQPNLKIKP